MSVGPSRTAPGCQYLHDIAQIFTLQNGFCSHFVKNRKNMIIILSISWKKEYVNINSGSADVFEIALCSIGDAGFSLLIPFSLQAWAGVCNHATIFFSILHTILSGRSETNASRNKQTKCLLRASCSSAQDVVPADAAGPAPSGRRGAASWRPEPTPLGASRSPQAGAADSPSPLGHGRHPGDPSCGQPLPGGVCRFPQQR